MLHRRAVWERVTVCAAVRAATLVDHGRLGRTEAAPAKVLIQQMIQIGVSHFSVSLLGQGL